MFGHRVCEWCGKKGHKIDMIKRASCWWHPACYGIAQHARGYRLCECNRHWILREDADEVRAPTPPPVEMIAEGSSVPDIPEVPPVPIPGSINDVRQTRQQLRAAKELLDVRKTKITRHARRIEDLTTMLNAEIKKGVAAEKRAAELEEIGITAKTQDRIQAYVLKHSGAERIDGSGCDSGDPVDLTLAEIGQGLIHVQDECHDVRQALIKYGSHTMHCKEAILGTGPCTCGFKEACGEEK